MASIIATPNVIRARNLHQNLSSSPYRKRRLMADSDEQEPTGNLSFGISSVLDTMDRFLDNNDGNHIVQLLIHLEKKTSVSRNALARCLLAIILCYFLFSIKVFDLAANVLLYFLPSYGTYTLLQKNDLTKEDLVDISRYWMFAGFFITVDPALTLVIPFWSFIKVFLAFQCFLSHPSPLVNGILNAVVTPIFRQLESNARISQYLNRQNAE